jgi:hypothetical protein
MPTPQAGETRDEFLDRCIPFVLDEGTVEDEDQAVAYCSAIWEREKGGTMGQRKTFTAPIELKSDGEEGTFRSVFASLNVIDHDGDVIRPGAFQEGQEVVVENWNHGYDLPPGKGVIHSDEEKAWIDGRFFLETTQGKDMYLTLKELDGLEEWSFTFDIEKAERGVFEGEDVRFLDMLDTWGVAPVTRGAGIGTETVALKGWRRLTKKQWEKLKALLDEQDTADGQSGQGRSEGAGGEGEGDGGGSEDPTTDANQSGVHPGVVLTEIDILDLEE